MSTTIESCQGILLFSFSLILLFGWQMRTDILYYYSNDDCEEKEEEEAGLHAMQSFDSLYILPELDSSFVERVDLNTLIDKVVIEESPVGKIIMYWNEETKSFEYYAERRDVPYRFLDTVARKYVIENECYSIFIDIKKELNINEIQFDYVKKRFQEKQDEKNSSAQDDVFHHKKKVQFAETIDKDILVKSRINHFKYKGSLTDYYDKPLITNEKICHDVSYSDYISWKINPE